MLSHTHTHTCVCVYPPTFSMNNAACFISSAAVLHVHQVAQILQKSYYFKPYFAQS